MVSEPVKTQYGYHLIEVTDITPEEQLGYDRVKESIRSVSARAEDRAGLEGLAGREEERSWA